MPYTDIDLKAGIASGTARALRKFEAQPPHSVAEEELAGKLKKVLEVRSQEKNFDHHFVDFYAEMTACAEVTRAINEEEPLTEEQMADFLNDAISFFNCFTHTISASTEQDTESSSREEARPA